LLILFSDAQPAAAMKRIKMAISAPVLKTVFEFSLFIVLEHLPVTLLVYFQE